MKKVLMIAFHYPPFQGGSGVHRTLKFSKYLPQFGWQPLVLTAQQLAYTHVGVEQLAEIPEQVVVRRAFALDTARHLSVRGHYSRLMALPDQWVTWWLGSVFSGLRMVRKYRPDALWSTYPIATAHLIALTLHAATGLPWVADFRDSMTEENYPRDWWSRQSYLWIERRIMRKASRLVFTAPATREMYLRRYPELKTQHGLVILNGYDEEDFAGIAISRTPRTSNQRPIRLVHAGVIYTDDRDPRPFFRTLSRLKNDGFISAKKVSVDLRASGSEEYYSAMLNELKIEDIVRLLPALPYRKSLQDCAEADALLIFQAASCNHQIPAKAYEYLRLGKPILGLTPVAGDTGKLLKEIGGATILSLDDENVIYKGLPLFLDSVREGAHALPIADTVDRFSRRQQAYQLSECLSESINT